jgi:hypothetical protein
MLNETIKVNLLIPKILHFLYNVQIFVTICLLRQNINKKLGMVFIDILNFNCSIDLDKSIIIIYDN